MTQKTTAVGYHFHHRSLTDMEEECLILKKESDILHLSFRFLSIEESAYEIQIEMERDWLLQRSDPFVWEQIPESDKQSICCQSRLILTEMLKSRWQAGWKQLFLESKSIELLLCYRTCQASCASCDACRFLQRDPEREKIRQAREILLQRLQQPPTIAELAQHCGMNVCYLKKGFREMYGSPIYEFITGQRMQKATHLLTQTELSIAEVANAVGYSSSGHFSQAFRRYKGILPTALRKN